jgi:allantoin racemase
MTRIYVINPNSSSSVTAHIRRELERIRRPSTTLTVENPAHGPAAIESAHDEVLSGPAILDLVRKANDEKYDAILLACFADPALDAAKELSNIPVIGIEEATLHIAAMLGHKFSILTSSARRISTREMHARLRNVENAFASAPVMAMSVLEMDADPAKAKKRALELARRAIDEDGAEVIVLGCAGLAGCANEIQRALGAVVLDPVAVGFKIAEALVELGLCHSKVRRFAALPEKERR